LTVSLILSDEQQQMLDLARSFFAQDPPAAGLPGFAEDQHGYDQSAWAAMADQLGVQGILIPEDYGGSGLGLLEAGLVVQESGRSLLRAPLLQTVTAAACLLLVPDPAAHAEFLPLIAAGQLRASLIDPQVGLVLATPTGPVTGWLLEGSAAHVPWGDQTDLFLVMAQTPDGDGLFVVRAGDGVAATAQPGLDPTRPLATVRLAGAPGRLVGEAGAIGRLRERCVDVAVALLAAESVGCADGCLALAVDYAKSRVQFGVPIGSFQAIKHKCADALLAVEAARAASYYALTAVTDDAADASLSASLAKARCTDAFFSVAAECVQIHGGIGFTWEHAAHLYLKRAKSAQHLLGSPAMHRSRMAEAAGI
jgi:alkylation response protein AidB-like acyl-CoA dehydrogenase